MSGSDGSAAAVWPHWDFCILTVCCSAPAPPPPSNAKAHWNFACSSAIPLLGGSAFGFSPGLWLALIVCCGFAACFFVWISWSCNWLSVAIWKSYWSRSGSPGLRTAEWPICWAGGCCSQLLWQSFGAYSFRFPDFGFWSCTPGFGAAFWFSVGFVFRWALGSFLLLFSLSLVFISKWSNPFPTTISNNQSSVVPKKCEVAAEFLSTLIPTPFLFIIFSDPSFPTCADISIGVSTQAVQF